MQHTIQPPACGDMLKIHVCASDVPERKLRLTLNQQFPRIFDFLDLQCMQL